MRKKYTMEEYMAGYKYAYIAAARSKRDITKFRNTEKGFLKSLALAIEENVNSRGISRKMFRRAKIVQAYYACLESDPARKRYLMTIMNRWGFMDELFNGAMPLEALEHCANARMKKLGVKDVSEAVFKTYVMKSFRRGLTVEDIKRALKAA